jgi:hypothetical protein
LDKNPVYVEAGRRGARKRWGEPRVLRLDQLDTDERRLIAAILNAKRNADAADEEAA